MWEVGKTDSDKRKMITDNLIKLGLDEDKIDSDVIWAVKKVCYKINKLRVVMNEKNIDDNFANEIIGKIVNESIKHDIEEIKCHSKCKKSDYLKTIIAIVGIAALSYEMLLLF